MKESDQHKEILDVIANRLLSKLELNAFLVEVERVQRAFYKSTQEERDFVDQFSHKYMPILRDLEIKTDNVRKLSESLENIVKATKGYEPIRVTLGFEPSDKFLREIQNALKKTLSLNCILDVEIDSTILGGIVIDYNGKHVDMSLLKHLDEYFTNNKNAILSDL